MEEVVRYSEAFWKQGPKAFTPDAWRRIRTRVEMREKKLAEVRTSSMNHSRKRLRSANSCSACWFSQRRDVLTNDSMVL